MCSNTPAQHLLIPLHQQNANFPAAELYLQAIRDSNILIDLDICAVLGGSVRGPRPFDDPYEGNAAFCPDLFPPDIVNCMILTGCAAPPMPEQPSPPSPAPGECTWIKTAGNVPPIMFPKGFRIPTCEYDVKPVFSTAIAPILIDYDICAVRGGSVRAPRYDDEMGNDAFCPDPDPPGVISCQVITDCPERPRPPSPPPGECTYRKVDGSLPPIMFPPGFRNVGCMEANMTAIKSKVLGAVIDYDICALRGGSVRGARPGDDEPGNDIFCPDLFPPSTVSCQVRHHLAESMQHKEQFSLHILCYSPSLCADDTADHHRLPGSTHATISSSSHRVRLHEDQRCSASHHVPIIVPPGVLP